jgi:glycosyltransferase involved in cell wall biosynthesis
MTPFLRGWDRRAAASASEYFANSSGVSAEIARLYGIHPLVIPPPPFCRDDGPWEEPSTSAGKGFFLVVSRLLPYKNLDRILEVFAQRPDLELVIVGTGPLEKSLKQSSPNNVAFIGNVNDGELRWLYGHCLALIAPAFEDYGLTPLEAASFGKPTIALRRGGYMHTVLEGTSGYFFEDFAFPSVSNAIDKLIENPLDGDDIRDHASRFSEEGFIETLRRHVSTFLA